MQPTLFLALWIGALATLDTHSVKTEYPLDGRYLRDHAETRGFMLGRPVQPKPTPDGKSVLFLRAEPRKAKLSLFEFDVISRKTRVLLTPEQVLKGADELLSPEEKARRERQRVTGGGFTKYQLSKDGSLILLCLSGKLYVCERATGKVRELATGAGGILDPKFSPDGKKVAYVLDFDVYVYDLQADKEHRATTGGTEKKAHGLAEFVAQEEMGRFSGYWWSPDSKFLIYEEADADGVELWYVADPAKPEQPALHSFYPRPGKTNVKVRAAIIPESGGDSTWIEWDAKKFPYLSQVRWEEHGPPTMTVQTRLQNEIALLKVDPSSGKTTPLIVESDKTWVNLHQETPRWRKDGTFLWTSETDGGPSLELRDADGKRVRVLVSRKEGFQGLIENHLAGSWTYKASLDPTRTDVFLCADVSGKTAPRKLSQDGAMNSALLARNESLYVLTETSADSMPQTTVHKLDEQGSLIDELPSVAEKPPFVPKIEFVKIGEGEGFQAAIVRPHGFDAAKQYPVIVYVYGGPRHLTVLASMPSWLLVQWLADQGFVVVALDNRGTPNRGHDWERAVYQKFGSVPLDDQVAGLKALAKKYKEMDLDRVGIYGWSFGGYMSALGVLKRPDVFKAAVAGAPVTDWEDYDTHYTERYMGLPKDHPEAYKEGSLLTYADKLERPLLLIHGTADDNVYFRHSLKLADALFRAGKDFEILPLAGLTHMVPDPVVMERLYGRIAQHFQKHLNKPR